MSKPKQSRIADFFGKTSIHTEPETIYIILIYVKQCKNELFIYLLFSVIVSNVAYKLNVCQSPINQVYCSICLFIIILFPTPYLLLAHLAERPCELLPSLGVCKLHSNLLLWHRLAIWTEILVGSIYGRSSIKIAHFVPICLQTLRS